MTFPKGGSGIRLAALVLGTALLVAALLGCAPLVTTHTTANQLVAAISWNVLWF